jgi:hypothetical protein
MNINIRQYRENHFVFKINFRLYCLKKVSRVITKILVGQKIRGWIQESSTGFFSLTPRSDRLFSLLSLIPKGHPGLFLPGLKQLRSAAEHSPSSAPSFKWAELSFQTPYCLHVLYVSNHWHNITPGYIALMVAVMLKFKSSGDIKPCLLVTFIRLFITFIRLF